MTRLAIFTTHPIQYQAPWFRALARVEGLEILVVFSYNPDPQEQGIGFGKAFTWDTPLLSGYSHIVLPSSKLPPMAPPYLRRRTHGVRRTLNRFRPDVAMILGWQELSLLQAMLACKQERVPIILRGESNALRRRPVLVELLHKAYFSLGDTFLAIGKSNAALYRRAGVPEDRIILAGYSVDNERFRDAAIGLRAERSAIREAWGIPQEANCFAFVGKLEPKKHVMHFLQALQEVRGTEPIHALVVGHGQQMDEAHAFVSAHRLPVSFAGFLNQSEIVRAYVAADALVLPSDYGETWGLVVNEAMACGLPPIVSDRCGSANDLVIHEKTGLVFPFGDIEALAAAMRQLARSPDLRRSLRVAAERRLSSAFSMDNAVRQTLAAIDMVMAKRPDA